MHFLQRTYAWYATLLIIVESHHHICWQSTMPSTSYPPCEQRKSIFFFSNNNEHARNTGLFNCAKAAKMLFIIEKEKISGNKHPSSTSVSKNRTIMKHNKRTIFKHRFLRRYDPISENSWLVKVFRHRNYIILRLEKPASVLHQHHQSTFPFMEF